jgi:hypothetical protein
MSRIEITGERWMFVWDRGRIANTVLVAAVLAVGGYVRLAHLDLAGFAQDQVRDAYVASGIVSGRSFPLMGVEAAGAAHTWGPLYFYLLAAPFRVSSDPSVGGAVLGVIALGSVWLTYHLGNVLFGAPVGIIAATLFATYPRIVMAAPILSNVTPVPFFSLLFFLSLFTLVTNRRSIMIVPILTTLAALVQFHLSTLSLGVVLVVTLALFRPRVRLGHLCIGLASALLLLTPYIVAQLLSRFQDIRAFLAVGAEGRTFRGPWELSVLADDILRTFPELMVRSVRGMVPAWTSTVAVFTNEIESDLIVVGVVFACGAAVVRSLRRNDSGPRQVAYVFVALWLAVPFATLGQRVFVVPHHFELLYPAAFLAAAAALSAVLAVLAHRVAPRLEMCMRLVVYAGLAAIVASQVNFQRQIWEAIEANGALVWEPGGSVSGTFEAMPIRYKEGLTRALVHDLGVNREAYFHRVHGSRFRDLLDDNGYFFYSMGRAWEMRRAVGPSAPLHYVVDRGKEYREGVSAKGVTAVGPYVILAYKPLIDYDTWQCSDDRTPEEGLTAMRRWTAIRVPTAREPNPATYGTTPFRSWRSLPVHCRGVIICTDCTGAQLRLVVSLRTSPANSHRVGALFLNGEGVAAQRVLDHTTFGGRTRDAYFDVGDRLWPGRNDIVLRIEGRGLDFDLDVYEIGR